MCAFLRCSNAVHLYSMPPVPVALCYPFEQTFFFKMFALHTSSYTHINPCKWTNTAWCDKTKTPFAERARKMEQTHRPRSVFNRGSGCERKVRYSLLFPHRHDCKPSRSVGSNIEPPTRGPREGAIITLEFDRGGRLAYTSSNQMANKLQF